MEEIGRLKREIARLRLINDLSREMCLYDLDYAQDELEFYMAKVSELEEKLKNKNNNNQCLQQPLDNKHTNALIQKAISLIPKFY